MRHQRRWCYRQRATRLQSWDGETAAPEDGGRSSVLGKKGFWAEIFNCGFWCGLRTESPILILGGGGGGSACCGDPSSFPMFFPAFWFFVHLEMVLCQTSEWWQLHPSPCCKNSKSFFKENSLFLSKMPSQNPSLIVYYGFGTQGLTKHAAPSSLSVTGYSSAFGTVHVSVFTCALVLALSPGFQMRTHLFPGKGMVDILPTSLFHLNASEIISEQRSISYFVSF